MTDVEALYRQYAPAVFRFALSLSGSRAAAEDLTSETFVRLWTARDRVELATVLGYLLTIARHLYLQGIARDRHRGNYEGDPPDSRPSHGSVVESRSELDAVLADLQRLPELDRAAVLMRAEDAQPYEEIGAALSISPGAAKVSPPRAKTPGSPSAGPSSPHHRRPVMTVTRNIVRDLLPLYAAGEASADTRLLIETWIKDDKELAGELAALRDDRPSSLLTERPRGSELHSVIAQTRSLLRRRALYLAGALTFTALPLLAFAYRLEGVHFPLERVPAVEAICIVAAAAFWTMFVMTMRRMRVVGL